MSDDQGAKTISSSFHVENDFDEDGLLVIAMDNDCVLLDLDGCYELVEHLELVIKLNLDKRTLH